MRKHEPLSPQALLNRGLGANSALFQRSQNRGDKRVYEVVLGVSGTVPAGWNERAPFSIAPLSDSIVAL